MARFNGATVLLIISATVSVYTCAIIAGAALGRTLDSTATTKQTPSDRTLRVSVSFRGLAEDFAKVIVYSHIDKSYKKHTLTHRFT